MNKKLPKNIEIDEYIQEKIKSLMFIGLSNNNNADIAKLLNSIYEDGFEDGANSK